MAAPEKIGLESQGLAAQGLAAQGLAALGLQPAGMLRISKGQQERYVWPVHLPGWLALGWRVAASASAPAATPTVGIPSAGAQAPEPTASIAPAADEPIRQDAATPAATRGRGKRGRRRKETEEALSAPLADTGISTANGISAASDASASDSDGPVPSEPVLEAEPPAAASEEPHLKPDPAPDHGPDPDAAAGDATTDGELSLMALPDDLFDDEPLI